MNIKRTKEMSIIIWCIILVGIATLTYKLYQYQQYIFTQQKLIIELQNKLKGSEAKNNRSLPLYEKLHNSVDIPLITVSNKVEEKQEEQTDYISMELPAEVSGEFKTYMDYRKITNRKSKQWEMQQSAITDEQGFRRYNDLYMVALGTYYSSKVGMEFEIELSSGKIIKCITGDIKDNRHTDSTNRYIEQNGNILEFIVDIKKIDKKSKLMGDMSYSGFEGSIAKITNIIEY